MAKLKKKQKKARSTAWKQLEKYVATRFGGERINRATNYSVSLPDVILPGELINLVNTKIVVECKHSQNQPFIDLLQPFLEKEFDFVIISNFLFWNLENTTHLLSALLLLDNEERVKKIVNKEIPKYIKENYEQAKKYNLRDVIHSNNKTIRMVVIAKKFSNFRVAYTDISEVISLMNNERYL